MLNASEKALSVGNLATASFKAAFFIKHIVLENLVYTRNFCIDTKKSSHHHPRMSIHKRIRERRELLWPSREAFAHACGVVWQTVQQWEKEGGTAPKRKRLDKVAELLQTSPEYLSTGRDPGERGKVFEFSELSGLEAQLVMLYRTLSNDDKHELSVYANKLVNKANPGLRSGANPFPDVEKQPKKEDQH